MGTDEGRRGPEYVRWKEGSVSVAVFWLYQCGEGTHFVQLSESEPYYKFQKVHRVTLFGPGRDG